MKFTTTSSWRVPFNNQNTLQRPTFPFFSLPANAPQFYMSVKWWAAPSAPFSYVIWLLQGSMWWHSAVCSLCEPQHRSRQQLTIKTGLRPISDHRERRQALKRQLIWGLTFKTSSILDFSGPMFLFWREKCVKGIFKFWLLRISVFTVLLIQMNAELCMFCVRL